MGSDVTPLCHFRARPARPASPVPLMSSFVVIVLLVVCPALARAAGAEQEIRAMEKLWNESRVRADVAALDRLLDARWTVTHGDGTINTKAEYLADLKSGDRKFFADLKQDDFSVRVYGIYALSPGFSLSK